MYEKEYKRARRKPVFVPDDASTLVSFGQEAINRMLPHRDPFNFVESIDCVDLDKLAIRAQRHIKEDDPVFPGHFPDNPVYPGVLLIEGIGQAGICLQHFLSTQTTEVPADATPQPVMLVRVNYAAFLDAVKPGDDVTMLVRALEHSDYVSMCIGQGLVNGKIKAVVSYEILMME